MERIIKTVKAKYPHLPMAMNGVGTDHLVSIWSHLPLDVIALDWRSSIVMANERGVTQTVQGNLDPAYLFGDEKHWPVKWTVSCSKAFVMVAISST